MKIISLSINKKESYAMVFQDGRLTKSLSFPSDSSVSDITDFVIVECDDEKNIVILDAHGFGVAVLDAVIDKTEVITKDESCGGYNLIGVLENGKSIEVQTANPQEIIKSQVWLMQDFDCSYNQLLFNTTTLDTTLEEEIKKAKKLVTGYTVEDTGGCLKLQGDRNSHVGCLQLYWIVIQRLRKTSNV